MASFFDNKARAAAAAAAGSSSKVDGEASGSTTQAATAPRLQPWVEKYRPKSLEEVKGQDHATETLRRMVNASNLPHLLLYGPPGTGKTSTILALCRELFGPELFSNRVMELNASDERGLSVIRERVKQFASLHLVNAPASKAYRDRYPCPPFKVIILDEADNLTQDAQSALRRVIEIHSKITRFCLCANYASRIIDPLASRCSKFRFKSLDDQQASDRLKEILRAERVSYKDDAVIERALEVSGGDLRRAINLLQSAAKLTGAAVTPRPPKKPVLDDSDEEMEDADEGKAATPSNAITVADIDEIAGTFPPASTDKLIKILEKGNTRNYSSIAAEINDIAASGYAANEVLSSLYGKLIFDDLVDSRKKNKLTQTFSEFDKRLVDGVDEQLALLDLSCQIAGVLAAAG
jgi:replication factor C subunit 2/4